MKESIVYERAFKFSCNMVKFYRELYSDEVERIILKQLLRSSTSIGANIKEALEASSKRDFLMKMNIALKEASETEYWIEVIINSDNLESSIVSKLLQECMDINHMLTAIVKKTKQNLVNEGKL